MIKKFRLWKLKRDQEKLFTRLEKLKQAFSKGQIVEEMYWIGLESIRLENKEIRSKILKLL
jgi:hypothetical protein